ncbi:MAG: hypothetical protein H0T43_00420 [Solirubrobacterales bacterium]|nr:hypothetical protein [Solirubrobacterales bacterium]
MLVLAGIVVAVVVVLSLGGDDGDAPPAPAARTVAVPGLGLAFSHPASWKREIDRRVIRLRSPDGSATLTFASPIAGREPARVTEALRSALRRALAPARVIGEGPGKLGNRDVTSFEVRGRARGKTVRALGIVDSTPYRTYTVTVLTPARPSRMRLQEVRAILQTVRLTEPVRSRR